MLILLQDNNSNEIIEFSCLTVLGEHPILVQRTTIILLTLKIQH